jgi:hypothetical protein
MRTATGIAALALVAVTGCAGNDIAAEPQPEPTPEPVVLVSVQTSCDELFLAGQPSLWHRAVTIMQRYDTQDAQDAMYPVAGELDEVASHTRPGLAPHVEDMAGMLRSLADGETVDLGDFKTSAREVANQCTQYVAADY